MSADCRTENFTAYFHPSGAAVFDAETGDRIGWFTPETARQLQSITSRWLLWQAEVAAETASDVPRA